jgi:hypothetical protein
VPTAKFEIPITRLDELSFREWVSDDSGEIVQDVRARAMNDMAFIGGIMHWRTKGPFYRVYGDSPGIQARHHIETAGLLSRPLCFRADRLDDARAFLEPHIGGRQPKVDTLIDVMDPDAYRDLAFDERADMTRALHRVAVWAADSETLSRIADERSRNSACNRADLKAAAFAYMSPAGLRAQAALMRIPVQSPDFIWDNRTLDSVGASLAALDAELPVKDNQQTRLTRFTEQWVSREGFERGLATMSEPRP